MTEQESIIDSLEKCAALDIDLTPSIYEHFFSDYPDALPLMGHSDNLMRGRMVDQVFELFLDDSQQGEGGYLRWEIDNHLDAYGVQVDMYPAFLRAVQGAVATALGRQWQREHEQAWQHRIDRLLSDIETHARQKKT